MSSHFVNLFKKGDADEQRAFQRKVHAVLSKLYPDRIFALLNDPLSLESDGQVIGLTNLHSNFLLSSQTEAELEEFAKAHLDALIKGTESAARELPWEDARNYLMPQLMPQELLAKAPVEPIHEPVADGVYLGFVIDTAESYSYVSQDDKEKWAVDLESIREAAFMNLHQRSQGIDMMAFPGENAFFIINKRDGFDAVRLLSSGIREVIAEHIGDPFFAGIPNRDFLICWSKSADPDFQSKMSLQVATDSDQRPYPLSRKVFEVAASGEIALAPVREPDPKAAGANLN
jgi:hypothetical protein